MPVIEKIETMKIDISNFQTNYDKQHDCLTGNVELLIEYDDSIEFKGWHSYCGIILGRSIKESDTRYSTKIEAA